MTNRVGRRIVVGLALAILVASLPVKAAARGRIVASINGVNTRWRGRLVIFTYSSSVGLAGVATKPYARKTISFDCPVLLDGQTFPMTLTDCTALYAQGIGARSKQWIQTSGFQVTFDSFNGTIVQGSFSGSLPAAPFHGDGTTLTVEGTFRAPIRRE